MRKTVWSLFDGSGIMGLPWAEAGHQVYCFNSSGADHGEYIVKMEHPNLHYVDMWITTDKAQFHTFPSPDIIFAFPSCTFMAVSGAKHTRSDNQKSYAVLMAEFVESLANHYGCPWMLENPVGRLSTEWRKPTCYFDPYEYGGYMSENDEPFHPKMPKFDGYTKKTCIWHGNGFVMPRAIPVGHIGCFWGWKSLGGKSQKTKQLRSLTPRGFSKAVFIDNSDRKDLTVKTE